jgi:Bacterial protein of unknown function (DUF885)
LPLRRHTAPPAVKIPAQFTAETASELTQDIGKGEGVNVTVGEGDDPHHYARLAKREGVAPVAAQAAHTGHRSATGALCGTPSRPLTAYDPEYLYYRLGKLEILKLREDYRNQEGGGFTLEKFHNEMLRHGAPPIRLLREVMLKDRYLVGPGALNAARQGGGPAAVIVQSARPRCEATGSLSASGLWA